MKNYYLLNTSSLCKTILGAGFILFGWALHAQNTYVVTSIADSGPGSLRDAIYLANADPVKDNIHFNIPGIGPYQITLQTPLPEIVEPVILDATTQPEYAWNDPKIIINGNGGTINGISLSGNSSGSEVKGFVIVGFENSNDYNRLGVGIFAENTGRHVISGNYIGITADGGTTAGNRTGIYLINSSDNVIGGQTESDRNVISGNRRDGIVIDGGYSYSLSSEGNSIIGNYIGTDPTGTLNKGNGGDGIGITYANNNTVGGPKDNLRNIISGNSGMGIAIIGHFNKIQGNYIGVGNSGTTIGNGSTGIRISGHYPDSEGNLIGGSVAGAGNVISGNSGNGIGDSGNGTKIFGNIVGLDVTGYNSVSNGTHGVALGGKGWVLGGPLQYQRNIISSENWSAVSAEGENGVVQGNYLGTNISGKIISPGLSQTLFTVGGDFILVGGPDEGEGNLIAGGGYADVNILGGSNWEFYNNIIGLSESQRQIAAVLIEGGRGHIIGGTEPGMGNTIRGQGAGVQLEKSIWGDPVQVKISGNQIYETERIGIDLTPQHGININDPGDADLGVNGVQNYPVISDDAALEGGNINLSYFLDSAPGNSTYPIQVEFFIEAGNRQAKEYLFYDVFTEADYNAALPKEISFPLPIGSSLVVGDRILSTATDAGGNTSEFGASVEVTGTCSDPIAICKSPFNIELGSDGIVNLTVEEVDNGSTASCGIKAMTIDKSEFTCADIGDNIVTLSVTDINGVTATCTTTVTVKDNSLPTLSPVSHIEVNLDEACQFTIPDYTGETIATDNCSTPVVTQEPAIGTVLSGHNTTQLVTLTADDGNGNKDSTSFTITLKDKTQPELFPIADKIGTLDESCTFIVPDYRPEVTATDSCSTPTLAQTPEAGFELLGNGTVQEIVITASDGNGNNNSTSFLLTLKDVTKPTISTVENQLLTVNENCEATLLDYSALATVSDNCDSGLIITQDPIAGTIINSETTVTLRVTDNAQNISSTSFLVSLEGGTTTSYFLDNDGDGFGIDSAETNIESCVEPGSSYSTKSGDCNDTDFTIYPGAFDVRGDGIDQDCSSGDELLACIGNDRLEVNQICSTNSLEESWTVYNPSSCAVEVTWETREGHQGIFVASPGETKFQTPTGTTKTLLTLFWQDKSGVSKRSIIVAKDLECGGAIMATSEEFSEGMVYPNPIADNGFWIEFPEEVGGQTFQAQIFNLSGQLLTKNVFEVPANGGELFWELDHSLWNEGTYPLVISNASRTFRVHLMVLK